MALARWEPFREIARIQDEMNRLFENIGPLWRFRAPLGAEEELGSGWYPPVDIYEDAEGLVMTAELPGIDPKAVDVRVENGVLTIQGERKLEHAERKEGYRRLERAYGSFTRSFTLPSTVDQERVKAEFKNGVLKLMLPKREESKPRAIKVKVE